MNLTSDANLGVIAHEFMLSILVKLDLFPISFAGGVEPTLVHVESIMACVSFVYLFFVSI
jgi:hypothetical protein